MSFARNVSEVGYEDLEGRSGFKLAIQEVNERFYLYTGALWEPGLSIVDVTEPSRPRFVRSNRRTAEYVDAAGASGRRQDDHQPRARP